MNNIICPFCGGNQTTQINEQQYQCMHCGKVFIPNGFSQMPPSSTPPPMPGQFQPQNDSKIPMMAYIMMGLAAFLAVMSFPNHHNDTMEMLMMLCSWGMGGIFVYIMFALRKNQFLQFFSTNSTLNVCYIGSAVAYAVFAFVWGVFSGDADDSDTRELLVILLLVSTLVFSITAFVLYGNLASKVSLQAKSWLTSLLPIAVLLCILFLIYFCLVAELMDEYDTIEKVYKFLKFVPLLNAGALAYFGTMCIRLDAGK